MVFIRNDLEMVSNVPHGTSSLLVVNDLESLITGMFGILFSY